MEKLVIVGLGQFSVGQEDGSKKEIQINLNDLTESKQEELKSSGVDLDKLFPMTISSSSVQSNIFDSTEDTNTLAKEQDTVKNNPQIEFKYMEDFSKIVQDKDCQKYTHLEMKDLLKNLDTEQLQAYYKLTEKAMEIEATIYKLNRATKEVLENRMLLGSKWSCEDGTPYANSEQKFMKKADELLKQMGGVNKLSAMTGANTFLALEDGLSFKFKGCKQCNYVKITVNQKDLYDMDFKKVVGTKVKDVKTEKDIDVSMLKKMFTKTTGLDLHL